jgi:hypothetical protein
MVLYEIYREDGGKRKKFETQLSNKYNMPYLIMINCKCDCAFDTTRIVLSATCTVSL